MTTTNRIPVAAAYVTDHSPRGGNITEEVLVLEDGRAVFMTPDDVDTLCASYEDAQDLCVGTCVRSSTLLSAWVQRGGYALTDDSCVHVHDAQD